MNHEVIKNTKGMAVLAVLSHLADTAFGLCSKHVSVPALQAVSLQAIACPKPHLGENPKFEALNPKQIQKRIICEIRNRNGDYSDGIVDTIRSWIMPKIAEKRIPASIEQNIYELKEIFPTGLIFSPSHEAILSDVQPHNLEVMIKAIKS